MVENLLLVQQTVMCKPQRLVANSAYKFSIKLYPMPKSYNPNKSGDVLEALSSFYCGLCPCWVDKFAWSALNTRTEIEGNSSNGGTYFSNSCQNGGCFSSIRETILYFLFTQEIKVNLPLRAQTFFFSKKTVAFTIP